ncbi:unnamed protein product [Anisakis simplex]|uniref:Protein UBASH3A homolog (inferred by orthology to a D. melanogaster protein) n=1 Tax=Anisakis simplex TaxID=6269 RepID=A0A158PNU0_ANISI|nr:unnamed protein product [Anisakis simplex]
MNLPRPLATKEHRIADSPKCVAASYGTLDEASDVARTARSSTSSDILDPKGVIRSAPRRLIVMRHGERIDDLFPDWIEKSSTSGSYRAYDLNMELIQLQPSRDLIFQPLVLPELDRPMSEYAADTVLTEMGSVLAQMVLNRIYSDVVYASPALRCIQTASFAMKAAGCDDQVKIRIEPALFEYESLYPGGQPKFATAEQLKKADFNIDQDYKPIMPLEKLWSEPENVEQYGDRLQQTLLQIADRVERSTNPFGPIVMVRHHQFLDISCKVVGHASTIDLAIGVFREKIRRAVPAELLNNGLHYPFCATSVFDRIPPSMQWKYSENALPPITYRNFTSRINSKFAFRTPVE